MAELALIRNFCVIAHVDHGKTTLSDRLLETTGTVPLREMRDQLLDSMELEREHGITIKARAVRMAWREHELNLIDTPGHVDFTYEVSRSLAACEGAVLLVDASQGIEAQTLANAYLAVEQGLEVIPVINKIDLPNIDIDVIREELRTTLGFRDDEILLVSGKTGAGVTELLDAIVEREPLPGYRPAKPMVFAGFYPSNAQDYPLLKDAMEKLRLNDASLIYEPETSQALGFGFRGGFLGLLHLEIIQERLEREYDIDLIATSPSVEYRGITQKGDEGAIDNPALLPHAGTIVDALSIITHRARAQQTGRVLVNKLRGLIPKQMFDVRIQAAIGGKIVASETVKAKRKDVLAKCYGGDITRKRKLLEKQKEGKARMRRVGRVDVPQEAFIAALRVDQRSGSSSK